MPRNRVKARKLMDAVAVSGVAAFTSEELDILYVTGSSFHIIWTGTLTGTFSIETTTTDDGSDWVPVAVTIPAAVGAPDSIFVNLAQQMGERLRLVYSNTAGAGDLTVWANGKTEGGNG